MSTLRQPPSSGENVVALSSEPSKKPSAMPMDVKPLASPSWCAGNHCPVALMPLVMTKGMIAPSKITTQTREMKSSARPRAAPNRLASSVQMVSTRLAPILSPIAPLSRLVTMASKEPMPHTTPTWTRFKPRSCEISLAITDMPIAGMATTSMLVRTTRIRMYHLYFWLYIREMLR